jgi:beta-lactamase superfamily II metal-dependent hydrolase
LLAKYLLPFNLKDGIFINNFIDHRKSFKEFWKWRKESKRPEPITFPLAQNDPSYLKKNTSEKTLTWVGHATFLLQINGYNILTDPHFSKRASPLSFMGPERTTPPGLQIDNLPFIDVVVISHNHYDHLDRQVNKVYNKKTKKRSACFFCTFKTKKNTSKIWSY